MVVFFKRATDFFARITRYPGFQPSRKQKDGFSALVGRQLKSGWIFRTVMPDVDRF
jgi:hypothetical protein